MERKRIKKRTEGSVRSLLKRVIRGRDCCEHFQGLGMRLFDNLQPQCHDVQRYRFCLAG